METAMSDADHTRRWLISASGAAMLSGALAPASAQTTSAQTPVAPPRDRAADRADDPKFVSAATAALAEEVAGALDRPLAPDVIASGKLHVLDTLGAIVSGSRLKAGSIAGRYVESIGGTPQAMVIGTNVVTSAANAAMANAMAAHADETDDTNPIGPVHLGCGAVPAALATAELAGRSGEDFLRAVLVGYDIGARMVEALGIQESRRNSPSCLMTTFVAAASAAAMLRLDPRQVRHTFSYAAQQASGIGFWTRDAEHVEKAFDFGGMGARNGVMAATMVGFGFSAVEDPFSGTENVYTSLADKPAPDKLLARAGARHAVFGTTIKKWTVGAPLQAVLDSLSVLIADPGVRADTVARIRVEMMTSSVRIVDNSTIPDLCLQHLAALMIVDGGATFASVHDVARMSDPKVLAVRSKVDLVPSEVLQKATPPRQATVTIDTVDGRTLSHHTTMVRGTAGNPMDAREVEAKALDLMTPVLGAGRTAELIAAIGDLDHLGPIGRLRPLLQA
jgi:2-methylcitrate dehydratase PrpD